ncbi:CPBP family intramembrane glutamic endopeptidase [Rhodanobacter sp. Col0626]|uniref:CPBP family intramembrane glutamic endopeptidase n=1 Tax=Rhodanobacter sp. Col0626 TaxID=3415679 RepID=UPI003CF24C6A
MAKSLRLYFVLAFGFAWTFWLASALASRGIITAPSAVQTLLVLLGSFAPFIAAFIALYRDGRWSAMRSFAGRSLRYRIKLPYLACAFFLMPLLGYVAALIHGDLGGPPAVLSMSIGQVPVLFLVLFLVGGSVNEEFGWAYAIDRLQERYPLFPATVVLGIIWGLWHLPLFFIVGGSQSFMPFWAFLMFTIGARLLFVWAYENNGKSILVTLVFHTTTNLTLSLFVLLDRSPRHDERGFIAFGVLGLLAGAIAATTRRFRMARCPVPTDSLSS